MARIPGSPKRPPASTFEVTFPEALAGSVVEDAMRARLTVGEWLERAAIQYLEGSEARATAREHRDGLLRQLLEELESIHGPISDEERRAVAREWPE